MNRAWLTLIACAAVAQLAGCASRPQMAAEFDDKSSGDVPRRIVKQERYTIVAQSETTRDYNRGALMGAGGNVAMQSSPTDTGYEFAGGDDDLPLDTTPPGQGRKPTLREMEGMPDATITQEEGRGMPDGQQGQEPYVANNEGEMLRPGASASESLEDSFDLDDLANSDIAPKRKETGGTKVASNTATQNVTTETASEALSGSSDDADVKDAIREMEASAAKQKEITGGGEDLAERVQKEATEANAPTAVQGLPVVTSETTTEKAVEQVTKDTLSDGTVETTRTITPELEKTSTAEAPGPVKTVVPGVQVGEVPASGTESADAALAGEMNDMAGEKGTIPPPEAPVDTPVAQKGAPAEEQVVPDDPASAAELASKATPAEPAETLPGGEVEMTPPGGMRAEGATPSGEMPLDEMTPAEEEAAISAAGREQVNRDVMANPAMQQTIDAGEETTSMSPVPEPVLSESKQAQEIENPVPEKELESAPAEEKAPAAATPVDEATVQEGAPSASFSEISDDESESVKIPDMNTGNSTAPSSPELEAAPEPEPAPAKEEPAPAPEPAKEETVKVEEKESAAVSEPEPGVMEESSEAEVAVEESTASAPAPEPESEEVAATTAAVKEVKEEAPEPEVEAVATEESATETIAEMPEPEPEAAPEPVVEESASEDTLVAMREDPALPEEVTGVAEESEAKTEPEDPTQALNGVPLKEITPASPMPEDVAVISTRLGDIVIALDGNAAPQTVTNFKQLANDGFYNRTTFHRVIPNFIVQGGDPNSKDGARATHGEGGPGYVLKPEISLKHKRGSIATARLPDDVNPLRYSNGSQFFICVVDAPTLDGTNTVFGEVIKGMEVVDKIANLPRDDDANPLRPLDMKVKVISRQQWEGE